VWMAFQTSVGIVKGGAYPAKVDPPPAVDGEYSHIAIVLAGSAALISDITVVRFPLVVVECSSSLPNWNTAMSLFPEK
jgi:hypothetical protein